MAKIKTPAAFQKTGVHKIGWSDDASVLRTKRAAEPSLHHTEDEMIRGIYKNSRDLNCITLKKAKILSGHQKKSYIKESALQPKKALKADKKAINFQPLKNDTLRTKSEYLNKNHKLKTRTYINHTYVIESLISSTRNLHIIFFSKSKIFKPYN